jgi:hypothetical protein
MGKVKWDSQVSPLAIKSARGLGLLLVHSRIKYQCYYIRSPKSKSRYDGRSVGWSVLVSSPIWGSWPDVNYCLTVTILSISGAPSDDRSGLSFVLVTWTASVQFSSVNLLLALTSYLHSPGARPPTLIWLRIGTSGGLLWTWRWTFRFHKMLGNSWVAVQLVAFQEGFSSMELVS